VQDDVLLAQVERPDERPADEHQNSERNDEPHYPRQRHGAGKSHIQLSQLPLLVWPATYRSHHVITCSLSFPKLLFCNVEDLVDSWSSWSTSQYTHIARVDDVAAGRY
jgi:hypothetical protein